MKRFWSAVTVAPGDAGWRVLLDGRPIRTPAGAPQIVPSERLARLLAEEWSAQGDTIDPSQFPLRDLADYAIDMVAGARDETIAKVLRYAETDTLCYRADPDEPLWRRQQAVWEPIVAAFEAHEGVRMERVSGVVHRPQPPETLAALRSRIEPSSDCSLAALEMLSSLASSLIVGLAATDPAADVEALWAAAELEEAWQVEQWGCDPLAQDRRERRRAEFLRAARFAHAARE